jgi:hypothetical protein
MGTGNPPFNITLSEHNKVPYCCPVCGGNGMVAGGFYNQIGGVWSTGGTATETCRACSGTGIVWG